MGLCGSMRVNPTVIFTFLLLSITTGIGVIGFYWGSSLADKALAGISEPELGLSRRSVASRVTASNPENGTVSQDPSAAVESETDITFLAEADILQTVQTLKQNQTNPANGNAAPTPNTELLSKFPLTAQDQGVLLEIRSARIDNDVIILETYLRNDSTETVRFLYSSFLEVSNAEGQSLTAFVEDLPGELPALGETFQGEIRIPQNLVGESKTLKVSLSDYPDRTLTLAINEVPMP